MQKFTAKSLRWLRRRWRVAAAAICGMACLTLWSCFPGPVPDLWPPRRGEPRYPIDVVYREWHAALVVPGRDPASTLCEEWEYCEQAWYLEGRYGFLGIPGAIRALLWPTASGVSCRPVPRLPAQADDFQTGRWTFLVSEKGLRALREYLESSRGPPIPAHANWYHGRRSYHLFHNCYHYAARGLRAAGLPIAPWWAYNDSLSRIQLERIRRWHEAEKRAGRL